MSLYAARCPIGGEQIDESSARVNGAIVVGVLLASILLKAPWLLAYLVIDFGIKVFAGFAYSPNCKIAGLTASAMKLPQKMTNSAPKRFAAIIGMLMAAAGLLAYYAFGSYAAFVIITAVFLVFASLEAFAGFCMGCFLYGLLPESFARALVRNGA